MDRREEILAYRKRGFDRKEIGKAMGLSLSQVNNALFPEHERLRSARRLAASVRRQEANAAARAAARATVTPDPDAPWRPQIQPLIDAQYTIVELAEVFDITPQTIHRFLNPGYAYKQRKLSAAWLKKKQEQDPKYREQRLQYMREYNRKRRQKPDTHA